MSRETRKALKRRKMADYTYRERLADVDAPGVRTADLRRKIKRQLKVRS